ncbi:hypothetical protein AB0K43_17465 [Kitasatospora sp. NPDC049258]|uniref:hypothetical protein n=1 Tax=Kitasatospora sp. NPDC049258 TaxID=3155394 RepID=UPI003420300A
MTAHLTTTAVARRAAVIAAAGVMTVAAAAGTAGAAPAPRPAGSGHASAAAQGGPSAAGLNLLLRADPWKVVETRRAPDRTWDQAREIPQFAGLWYWTVTVDHGRKRMLGAQSLSSGKRFVQSVQQPDGSWSEVTPMVGLADLPVSQDYWQMGRIKSSWVNGQLQVTAIDPAGRVLHTVERADGSWQPWGVVSASSGLGSGQFFSVATTELNGELQLVGTTWAGEVLHTIRHADGSWQPWGNVMGATGTPSPWGWTTDVAVAGINGALQVVVCDNSQVGAYHAIRGADGRWTRWGDVPGQVHFDRAGYYGSNLGGVDGAAVDGEFQLVFAPSTNTGDLYHTIRHADGRWDQAGHVQDAVDLSRWRPVATGAAAAG